MRRRQDGLGVRVGRDNQRRVGRLVRAWRRRPRRRRSTRGRRRWRRVHLRIRIPGRRVLLGSVGRGHMAVDRRRVVTHVRGGRTHAGGRSRVVHLMLPARRRHGRLPMGHCGQMMVHHVQARRAGCLASMGAMRSNYQGSIQQSRRSGPGLGSHSACQATRVLEHGFSRGMGAPRHGQSWRAERKRQFFGGAFFTGQQQAQVAKTALTRSGPERAESSTGETGVSKHTTQLGEGGSGRQPRRW